MQGALQSPICWDTNKFRAAFLASTTFFVSDRTTNPLETGVAHALAILGCPSISIIHNPHPAYTSNLLSKHKCGISIPFSKAASSTVFPSSAVISIPFILSLTNATVAPPF